MILATHNSLSYLKPQWWLRPFAWVGRCQNLTIKEQLELGVKYFDIRMKFKKGEWMPESGHGLLTYKCSIYYIMQIINKHKSCVVRLTLENKKAPDYMKTFFKMHCKALEKSNKNITFVGGFQKGTWEHLYDFHNNVDVIEKYWLFSKKQWFPFPFMYALVANKEYKKIETDGYLMLDFVDIPDKVF